MVIIFVLSFCPNLKIRKPGLFYHDIIGFIKEENIWEKQI